VSFGNCFVRYGLAAFGSVLLVGALWPRSGSRLEPPPRLLARPAQLAQAAQSPQLPQPKAAMVDPKSAASQADEPVSWQKEIRPLLGEKCLLCHGPDPSSRKADLRLDGPAGYLADLGGYSAVAPGELDESELIYRISTADEDERMPPAEHGERLSAEEVDLLRRWVEQGAQWEAHWAYAPFREVSVPANDAPIASPIDAFIQTKLTQQGLQPAALADPATQLRRLHLDLTGLPPSLSELASFLADPSEAAYAQRVDSLLASPEFAVRWARPWLDAARYADSHGFTIDGGRNVWPWRDWVVDAIDADLPFDQFTIEQLAGDLLPDASRSQRLATGFHRNTQVNQEGGAKDEENRVNAVIDRTNTTGSVWMGATMGCAQCHTHKYDPISHTEYFQVYAFFNQTRDSGVSSEPSLLVARNAAEEARAQAWETEQHELRAAIVARHQTASAGWETWQPRAWASNGPELRPEEDGSYSVVGQNAVFSTYFLQARRNGKGLSALRLEALPMGGGGPGRASNGNFVLQQIRVYARNAAEVAAGDASTPDNAEDSGWVRLPLAFARADIEQDTRSEGGSYYPIAATLDDGPGWAIKPGFGQPHVAQWYLAEALPAGDWELRVELQQEHGANHTLGAFRILLDDQSRAQPSQSGVDPSLVDADWRVAIDALREHQSMRPRLPMSLVMEAREVPRTTHLFGRGSFLDPKQVVEPGYPVEMNHFAPDAQPRTRLDLARWLVDERNALVHRVTVNRWWQQLFGLGLVETENDFGLRGAQASHPDLLEWLAKDYVEHGYSRKHVVRQIVRSHAYRQASTSDAATREVDPRNRLLARQSRLRLEGEVLRDAALSVSGLLNAQRGGPPVQPPQPDGVFAFTQSRKTWNADEGDGRYRRSLYTRIWRSSPFPFYTTFDAPSASNSCTRRGRSNTALQALTLANDPMILELAAGLGGRLSKLEQPFEQAFLLMLSRPGLPVEIERLRLHWQSVANARDEQAAWTSVGRVLLNLDEFLNRP
jgi:hypothetical protein